MTPERQSLLDEIRARAMSDEGLSDADMADYQDRQQALMQIAEKEGPAAAIRASVKPRAKAKPKAKARPRAQQGDVRKAEPSSIEQMLIGRPTSVPASTAMRGMQMNNPLRQAAADRQQQEPAPEQVIAAMQAQAQQGAPAASEQEQMGMIARLMAMLQGGGQATMQAPMQAPQQRWGGPQPGAIEQATPSFLGRPMR